MDFQLSEIALLLRKHSVAGASETAEFSDEVSQILSGKHIEIVSKFDGIDISIAKLTTICLEQNEIIYDLIIEKLVAYSYEGSDNSYISQSKLILLFVYGVSLLEVYCQSNYTGPELSNKERKAVYGDLLEDTATRRIIIQELECDGLYPYQAVDMPHLLLISRVILGFLANPLRLSWKDGVVLSDCGVISLKLRSSESPLDNQLSSIQEASKSFISISWWYTRSLIYHYRILQGTTSYMNVPTLWQETQEHYQQAFKRFTATMKSDNGEEISIFSPYDNQPTSLAKCNWTDLGDKLQAADVIKSHCTNNEEDANSLLSKLLLEYGLCLHYFRYGDQGKKAFLKAKDMIQLTTNLTAALGKRTKYQREDIAQLYVYAQSSLMKKESATAAPAIPATTSAQQGEQIVVDNNPEAVFEMELQQQQQQQQQEAEQKTPMLEIGRRMVQEVKTSEDVDAASEEAALREVPLDQVDSGVENIILEGGPRFKTTTNVATAADGSSSIAETFDQGGRLTSLDQVILLALCLNISNSQPAQDALTHEEMLAYIERVLYDNNRNNNNNQSNSQHTNWMVYSTALLERSWIEFEKRKTADRAMLQIQALIDQHSTKLTITQASYRAVTEQSASLSDRMLYVYQLVYPSLFELKKDLAYKYLSCQVFMSALNYFKELEMWDEVVTCYQLMQKPTRAEIVVREQLKSNGNSPYMLTSLADLTGKEELYEQAWEVSRHRFARAKRTLGKISYDRKDFPKAIEHLSAALGVQPLVHTAWYLKGISCMRCERWEEGLEAFVRVIQQDSEVGEAWANMGAIHMHRKDYPKAHHAFLEAIKWKRDDWRILENMLTVCMALSKWKDSLLYMGMLIDLRYKQEQQGHAEGPLHLRELYHVTVKTAALMNRLEVDENYDVQNYSMDLSYGEETVETIDITQWPREVKDKVMNLHDLTVKSEQLLNKITSSLKSNASVWDIVARFHHVLGRYQLTFEARLKQFRALVMDEKWMKDVPKIQQILQAAQLIYDALHFQEIKGTSIYEVKMLLNTISRHMDSIEGLDAKYSQQVKSLIVNVEGLYGKVGSR